MDLSNLKPPAGAVKKKRRLGRGPGSGHGKTAGRGHKGQKSRSGASIPARFEGGQMPIHRRLPKRGFTNIFRVEYTLVKVGDLARFDAGTVVDTAKFLESGLLRNPKSMVKVLSDGELSVALTVKADKFSKAAQEKITAAGGTVEINSK
jgi:large subunit ribosomal protein L15